MSYKLKIPENDDIFIRARYVNDQGNTECVEFVRQATGAPKTTTWKKGKKVSDANSAEIARGTAIATFDADGKYPTDGFGKHAAIYLRHNEQFIQVLDQWNSQGKVRPRPIWFDRPANTKRVNDADTYYVIE